MIPGLYLYYFSLNYCGERRTLTSDLRLWRRYSFSKLPRLLVNAYVHRHPYIMLVRLQRAPPSSYCASAPLGCIHLNENTLLNFRSECQRHYCVNIVGRTGVEPMTSGAMPALYTELPPLVLWRTKELNFTLVLNQYCYCLFQSALRLRYSPFLPNC